MNAATQITPQSRMPSAIVPNSVLALLAAGDPGREVGMISEHDQSILSVYLTDICIELIALREAVSAPSARIEVAA